MLIFHLQESWGLPRWYHPQSKLNFTTIELLNKLSKPSWMGSRRRKRGDIEDDANSSPPIINDDSISSTSSTSSTSQSSTSSAINPPPTPPFPTLSGVNTNITNTTFTPPEPSPRFPSTHPLTAELYGLYETAAVVHFTALGKPWTHSGKTVAAYRNDAHPVFAELFEMWRTTAQEVCPGGIPMMGGLV